MKVGKDVFNIEINQRRIYNPLSWYNKYRKDNIPYSNIEAVINCEECHTLNNLHNSKIIINGNVYDNILCYSTNSEIIINGNVLIDPEDWYGYSEILKIGKDSKNCTIKINGEIEKRDNEPIIGPMENTKIIVKGKEYP